MRIVVAEDSPTLRQLLAHVLAGEPDIAVVGEATNGAEAVELVVRFRPDLVAMDIHMPVMDGLEATREIMTRAPTPIVLITSSTSRADAALSFEALRAGALTVVAKPQSPTSPDFNGRRDHLVRTLRAMADVKVVRRWRDRRTPPAPAAPRHTLLSDPVRVVAVAASTGGPVALQQLLRALPARFEAPILVVQHIAAGFVGALADWLGVECALRVKVAEHGEGLTAGTVYLAPDERHLEVTREQRVALRDSPPVGGHRPSADPLFRSVAATFGGAAAAIILTGMGRDGVEGLRSVKDAGGVVIAQDEETCVVYGMPREAAVAGVVDAVIPLGQIASQVLTLVNRASR